jgi:cell division protein FtsI/penicillin-binding protein 2
MPYVDRLRSSVKIKQSRRGQILDRNGVVLATTDCIIDIGIDPYVADYEHDFSKIQQLAALLKMSNDSLKKYFKKYKYLKNQKVTEIRWKKIKTIEDDSLFERIMALKIKGIYGNKKYKRSYPTDGLASQLIGFINNNGIASCGIEKLMDKYLKGQDGLIKSEKDGKHQELRQFRKLNINVKNGCDIELSLDLIIQDMVEKELGNIVNKFHPQWATIILSDAVTGEIMALGNHPTYNNNRYNKATIDSLRNRSVTDIYEPGSVFKIVASSIALERGLVTPETLFDCSKDYVNSSGMNIKLPKDPGNFNELSLIDVLRKSSNRGMAQIGIMLGKNGLYKAAKAFGFGKITDYGFDGEVSGILHPPNKWDSLTITRLPMGHALGATPMQMHQAMGVIASGGFLLKPLLVKKVVDSLGNDLLEFHPEVKNRVLSDKTTAIMADILRNPNNKDSTINGLGLSYKTGTSQKIVNGKYSSKHHVSSCSGFFPSDAPQILITVVVDDAIMESGIAWGYMVALPSLKSLIDKISRYIDIQ